MPVGSIACGPMPIVYSMLTGTSWTSDGLASLMTFNQLSMLTTCALLLVHTAHNHQTTLCLHSTYKPN